MKTLAEIKDSKDIYKMKLHDVIAITPKSIDNVAFDYYSVMRVAGGWIYQNWDDINQKYDKSVFVPFNNEFMSNNSLTPSREG